MVCVLCVCVWPKREGNTHTHPVSNLLSLRVPIQSTHVSSTIDPVATAYYPAVSSPDQPHIRSASTQS